MKQEKVNIERRKLFAKFGLGAVSAGLLNSIPFKLFSMSKNAEKKSEQKISISINPMAVKRTNKG